MRSSLIGGATHDGAADGATTAGHVRTGGSRLLLAADVRDLLLRFYYFATPLFFLVDWIWGISVRASFLPSPELRLGYYGFCLACALVCQNRPSLTPAVGIGESGVNLLLLALGVMLPIWSLPDAVMAGGPLPAVMTPARLMNILLSGSIMVLAFHRYQNRLVPPRR